jgi:hypothetical protein
MKTYKGYEKKPYCDVGLSKILYSKDNYHPGPLPEDGAVGGHRHAGHDPSQAEYGQPIVG